MTSAASHQCIHQLHSSNSAVCHKSGTGRAETLNGLLQCFHPARLRDFFCAVMLSRNLYDTLADRNSVSFSPCNHFPVENTINLYSFNTQTLTSLGHEVATQQGHGGEPAWVGLTGVG